MSKRRGDYSSSSNENQKANRRNFDLGDSSHKEFDSLYAVWQKLSESIVSLSFIGDRECYQYTGLCIKSSAFGSCFLTSATAIRSKQGGRKLNMDMSIYVNLPNGQMMRGSLRSLDFDYNIAVIGLGLFHVFKEASLDQPREVGYNNSVAAICCDSTGNIMSLTGVVTGESSELYGQKLIMSTCVIPEFGIGGPLVDSEGNCVGINLSHVNNEGTLFLPKERISESIVAYWLPSNSVAGQAFCRRAMIKQGSDNQIERSTSGLCISLTPVIISEESCLSIPAHEVADAGACVGIESRPSHDKSPETNQKSSVSATSDSESESSHGESKLGHF